MHCTEQHGHRIRAAHFSSNWHNVFMAERQMAETGVAFRLLPSSLTIFVGNSLYPIFAMLYIYII